MSFLILFVNGKASAAERFDVFFVAVGSGSYIVPPAEGVNHLPSIPGAVKSAKAVASLLEQGGSTFGVTLVSDNSHFVSRDDMDQALSRVAEEIRRTNPRNSLLVFYFAGHGIADGLSWYQFLLPGNFAYRGDLSNLAFKSGPQMELSTLMAADLVVALSRMNIPFLILLDTCYEGTPNQFVWKPAVPDPNAPCPPNDIINFCENLGKQLAPVIELDSQMKKMTESFNQMAADFRQANRFENTYPVIFATGPGNKVLTVTDPLDPDPRATAVAPLARRADIILSPVLRNSQALSLAEFIRQITSPALDGLTTPGVSNSPIPANAGFSLVDAGSPPGRFESRVGTAVTPVICCAEP